MSKTKFQKQCERRNRIRREKNVAANRPKPKFVLHVNMDGKWKPVMGFLNEAKVKAYLESVEEVRRNNTSDIVEGTIYHVGSGREVARIASHKMTDPAMLDPERKSQPPVIENGKSPA